MACVVVRYHEIALKGGNRQRFVQRLVQDGFAKDVHEVVARTKSELQD